MRVEVNVLESGTEPRVSVQHQSALMMALRTGSIEVGSRCSEMMRFTFGAGELCLVPRHVETWLRTDELHYLYLSVDISDAALAAADDGTRGDVELRRVGKLVDARVGALAAAVNALNSVVAGIPTFGPVVSWLLRGISNLGNGLHILQTKFYGHQQTEWCSMIYGKGLTVGVCGEQCLRMAGRCQVD